MEKTRQKSQKEWKTRAHTDCNADSMSAVVDDTNNQTIRSQHIHFDRKSSAIKELVISNNFDCTFMHIFVQLAKPTCFFHHFSAPMGI